MNNWVALIGRRREGRVEAVRYLTSGLSERGLRVGGFLQADAEAEEDKGGFDLVNLQTNERFAFARVTNDLEKRDLCDYHFDMRGFELAREWVAAPSVDVVLLEAGRLEAAGRGHWEALQTALKCGPRLVLLTIRPRYVGPVAIELPEPSAALELPASEEAQGAFLDEIVALHTARDTASQP